ncbi:hypothetical protein F5Y17DRAFT_271356 [Xylariaceae sp. FL0594]|nr:hypothetical protein F5Y17DRAFT_271356 [Xylariaceae sp. FL0594]
MLPDMTHLQSTADSQHQSTLFGRLPLEIREMIYTECWAASGLRHHVYLSPNGAGLAHSPCLLKPGQADERNAELQRLMSCQGQNRRGSRSRSSLVVDRQWASRFSSPWHEHWPCEEEMLRRSADGRASEDDAHQTHRTLFLPILLSCKRASIEALPSLYASVTLVFTDLEAAHRCLRYSPTHRPSNLVRSFVFSLALPYQTLHEQRFYASPSLCPGPWARLCGTLSNMARFASLSSVVIRLDLRGGGCGGDDCEGEGAGDVDVDMDDDWRRVRERWALCAVRGILARRLTVQLPAVVHPEWSRPYQYVDDGDQATTTAPPPFRLERYPKLRWVSVGNGRLIEPLVDPPSPTWEDRSQDGGSSQSKLRGATRELKEFVAGLVSD